MCNILGFQVMHPKFSHATTSKVRFGESGHMADVGRCNRTIFFVAIWSSRAALLYHPPSTCRIEWFRSAILPAPLRRFQSKPHGTLAHVTLGAASSVSLTSVAPGPSIDLLTSSCYDRLPTDMVDGACACISVTYLPPHAWHTLLVKLSLTSHPATV